MATDSHDGIIASMSRPSLTHLGPSWTQKGNPLEVYSSSVAGWKNMYGLNACQAGGFGCCLGPGPVRCHTCAAPPEGLETDSAQESTCDER